MIRYAILYFVLLVIFIALIVGPVVAGKYLDFSNLDFPMQLLQPTGLNNNDTSAEVTGRCANGVCPVGPEGGSGGAAATGSADDSDSEAKLRRFMAF